MAGLKIHDALTLIHNSVTEFSLSFWKRDGSELVQKARVRVNRPPVYSKNPRKLDAERQQIREWNHHINRSHNLLLFDIEKNHPFEVKICLIMAYNDVKIDWTNGK